MDEGIPRAWLDALRRVEASIVFPATDPAGGPAVAVVFPKRSREGFQRRLMLLGCLGGRPAFAQSQGHSRMDPGELLEAAWPGLRELAIDPNGFARACAPFADALGGKPFEELDVAVPGEGKPNWRGGRGPSDAPQRFIALARQRAGTALAGRVRAAGFPREMSEGLELLGRIERRDYLATLLAFLPGEPGRAARGFAREYPTLFCLAAGVPAAWRALMAGDPPAAHLFPGSRNPEAVAARFRGCEVPFIELLGGDKGQAFLGFVAAMPLDWVPSRPDEVLAAVRVALDLPVAEATLRVPAARLVESSGGRWVEFSERYRRAADHGRGRAALSGRRWDMRALCRDADDRVLDLARRIISPLMARSYASTGAGSGDPLDIARRAVGIAHGLLHARRSLPAILEASARWHRLQPAVNAAMPHQGRALLSWGALSPPFRHGAVEVRPLLDAQALREEGADGPDRNGVPGLAHCVSGYAESCWKGRCDIVSVRRIELRGGGYERLSTAEIEFAGDGAPFVRQHRSRRNAEPPAEAVDALAAYLALGLRRRDLPPEVTRAVDPIEAGCGYDWTDDALVAAALEAYAPLMPASLRGLDEAALSERLGIPAAAPGPVPGGP